MRLAIFYSYASRARPSQVLTLAGSWVLSAGQSRRFVILNKGGCCLGRTIQQGLGIATTRAQTASPGAPLMRLGLCPSALPDLNLRRQPNPLGRTWHSVLIEEEEQIVARRSNISIRRRDDVDRRGCSAGDGAANVSLVMVEGVSYRAGPHEHDLRDSPGGGRIYRKGRSVGDRRWRSGDRRTRLEKVR